MNWIRLSGPRCINLDRVNMIDFEPINDVCTITWATGDAPLELQGVEAVNFMTAFEKLQPSDAQTFWFDEPLKGLETVDDSYRDHGPF